MSNLTMKDTLNSESKETKMLEKIGHLETQVADFAIMLGQHNKQIYKMSIIITDLLKRLESKGDQSI